MSVIQDALRRKLQEQRAAKESRVSEVRPEPPLLQTPPVAQEVLQNEASLNPSPRVPERQPASAAFHPVQNGRQRVIRLLLATIVVFLTVGLLGAVVYFVDARKEELLRSAASTASPIPLVLPLQPTAVSASGVTGIGPTEEAVKTKAEWPRVKVGGVLAGGGSSRSSAILNGDMVRINGKVQRVRLVSVSDDGVTLEFEGRERFVEIGSTTKD